MKCDFCGRDVPAGTQECPYCHYVFKQEATVLDPHERDGFEGVTIDESGYEESAGRDKTPDSTQSRQNSGGPNGAGHKIYVKNFGCGSSFLLTLLVLALLIGFFMPIFLIVAGIGVVYYLIRSFLGL